MNMPDKTREQLDALSYHLIERREAILQAWRTATTQALDKNLTSSLSRAQFNDHIPGVLKTFTDTLRAWPDQKSLAARQTEEEQVSGHGLQRWQQGYQLRDVTREWGYLQLCLLDELDSYAQAHPDLEPEVMRAARRALVQLCNHGISASTTRYWRLQQAEAAGHVSDLEQALATLNELEQSRAETWREAAHDLRGSLTVVKGTTSLLNTEGVPEPARGEFLAMLQRGVTSLHEMLEDLMGLARLDAGQEERNIAPFDAGALLREFCEASQPLAAARGLFLHMEGPESLPAEGDRIKIQRILQNLLLNALKYTQKGGVSVIWGLDKDHDTDRWVFCVQDTGPGLDAGPGAPLAHQIYDATQIAHEIEEAGGQTEPAPTLRSQLNPLPQHQEPGEGVGLSIVRRLCELLDASIELETSPGQGSTFRVILPRCYEDAE